MRQCFCLHPIAGGRMSMLSLHRAVSRIKAVRFWRYCDTVIPLIIRFFGLGDVKKKSQTWCNLRECGRNVVGSEIIMVVEVRGSSPRKALTLPSRRALIGPPGRPVCAKRERKSAMHTWVPQSLTTLKFMLWMHQSLCIEVFPPLTISWNNSWCCTCTHGCTAPAGLLHFTAD